MRIVGWIAALALALGAPLEGWAVTLDFSGVTQAGGPHDAFVGEFDVTDTNLLNGNFGPSGTSSLDTYNDQAGTREATNIEYGYLASSNNQYLQTLDPGAFDNAWLRFQLDTGLTGADRDLLTDVFIHVEGRQGNVNDDDWHMFAWDYTQQRYLRLSLFFHKAPDEVREATLNAGYVSANGLTLGAASDLVDPTTGQLTVMVVNQDTSEWMRVDTMFVELTLAVPEPAALGLLGVGLLGLLARRRVH